jgi:hypothetical protein
VKTYWGIGGTTLHILDLGTRSRRVASFTPRPLYPQSKSARYPLDRNPVGPHSRSVRGDEEKRSQSLPGLEPPISQPVDHRYTTELTRFPLLPTGTDKNRMFSTNFRIDQLTPEFIEIRSEMHCTDMICPTPFHFVVKPNNYQNAHFIV